MLLLAFGLLVPATAYAQAEQCLDKVSVQEIQEKGVPSCRSVNGGEWEPYWENQGPGDIGSIVVVMIVVALVWSAIPVVASVKIASDSGQSTGVAAALGLVGGWAGLLGVYLMSRSDTRQAVHGAVDAMGPRTRVGVRSTEDRLRALAALRDDGSITEAEYAAQRQAIISGV